MKKTSVMTLFALVILLLMACSPQTNPTVDPVTQTVPTPQAQSASRAAQVQSVEVQTLPTNPPQVNAVVRGNLTESCATLGESQTLYASNTFQVTVNAVTPADVGCVQATTPFEATIPLNIKDLPAGTYTVVANGVSAVFTLPITVVSPTVAPTSTSAPAPTNSACVDSAAFVADVTIPDNTVVSANRAFTKTWRLKNTGTCTWDNNYLVAYISGVTMSQQPGYFIVQQGQTVAPNQTVDVSVGMTAPADNGNYVSYWGLKKVDGQFMPIQGGANGNSFYVKVKVTDGIAVGKITAAAITIEPEQGSGAACTVTSTYFVHAAITADGATTATYEIGSTAGQIPAGYFQDASNNSSPYLTGTVTFDQAGTQTINYRFVGPYPYPNDITVNLRVNGGEWINTKLLCQ